MDTHTVQKSDSKNNSKPNHSHRVSLFLFLDSEKLVFGAPDLIMEFRES